MNTRFSAIKNFNWIVQRDLFHYQLAITFLSVRKSVKFHLRGSIKLPNPLEGGQLQSIYWRAWFRKPIAFSFYDIIEIKPQYCGKGKKIGSAEICYNLIY